MPSKIEASTVTAKNRRRVEGRRWAPKLTRQTVPDPGPAGSEICDSAKESRGHQRVSEQGSDAFRQASPQSTPGSRPSSSGQGRLLEPLSTRTHSRRTVGGSRWKSWSTFGNAPRIHRSKALSRAKAIAPWDVAWPRCLARRSRKRLGKLGMFELVPGSRPGLGDSATRRRCREPERRYPTYLEAKMVKSPSPRRVGWSCQAVTILSM